MNISGLRLTFLKEELDGNPTAMELIEDLQEARAELARLKSEQEKSRRAQEIERLKMELKTANQHIEGFKSLCEKQKRENRKLEDRIVELVAQNQKLKQEYTHLRIGASEFDAYQERSAATAVYPGKGTPSGLMYAALGLGGESGEVQEKVKKFYRDMTELPREAIAKELGDVLWYVAAIARECRLSLGEIAAHNLAKLLSRKERGVLQGSGDNR